MTKTNLTVVIHTEEEFDWEKGFFRENNKVNHGEELVRFAEQILATGVRLVLAMDYAFVESLQGTAVIEHFQKTMPQNFEFATHLHPWVNPPFDEPSIDGNEIDEFYSYPGNLNSELEEAKLVRLTEFIEEKAGVRPTTYLAGRYGIGKNTYKTLRKLGYTLDVSISAFADFSHQKGPNFSAFNNSETQFKGVKCIPHTTGYVSRVPAFSNFLNMESKNLHRLNNNIFGKALLKLLGVKRVRLSPEGFSFKNMKKLIVSLSEIGVKEFIFSFHSPSVKQGLTPYVMSPKSAKMLKSETIKFLHFYNETNKRAL